MHWQAWATVTSRVATTSRLEALFLLLDQLLQEFVDGLLNSA